MLMPFQFFFFSDDLFVSASSWLNFERNISQSTLAGEKFSTG